MTNVPPAAAWLRRFASSTPSASLRLFCFPYAGRSPSAFHNWPAILPLSLEVLAVQLPGREVRVGEPPFTRMAPLVQALADALRPHLDRPFAFFGHSLGALVSFEVARELRRRSAPCPQRLLVSAHAAPQLPRTTPILHTLPEDELLKEVCALGGIPEPVRQNPELLALVLPLLRADFTIRETLEYSPEPPLDLPIVAFGGLSDERVSQDMLLAWQEQTTASFSLHLFQGNHFFLHSSEHELLDVVARELGLA